MVFALLPLVLVAFYITERNNQGNYSGKYHRRIEKNKKYAEGLPVAVPVAIALLLMLLYLTKLNKDAKAKEDRALENINQEKDAAAGAGVVIPLAAAGIVQDGKLRSLESEEIDGRLEAALTHLNGSQNNGEQNIENMVTLLNSEEDKEFTEGSQIESVSTEEADNLIPAENVTDNLEVNGESTESNTDSILELPFDTNTEGAIPEYELESQDAPEETVVNNVDESENVEEVSESELPNITPVENSFENIQINPESTETESNNVIDFPVNIQKDADLSGIKQEAENIPEEAGVRETAAVPELDSLEDVSADIQGNVEKTIGALEKNIKEGYRGATITALVEGIGAATGEVVFNIDNIITLKTDGVIVFVSDDSIPMFY